MLEGFLKESIIGRAVQQKVLTLNVNNLRDWGEGVHKIVDDRPFGGGAGMVLKPGPLFEAIESIKKEHTHVIYMSPDGELLNNPVVQNLAQKKHLLIVSGHYEGIDERVRERLIDQEISVGDYVLTNGTLPAAILVDAVMRYIPGVLGEEKSLTQDAFHGKLLSFPQYTRPSNYRGLTVPEVLLSGNHGAIEKWRAEWKKKKTQQRRPDLLERKILK